MENILKSKFQTCMTFAKVIIIDQNLTHVIIMSLIGYVTKFSFKFQCPKILKIIIKSLILDLMYSQFKVMGA